MTDWRISVVIPAFNSSRTLPRALSSVVRQTVQPDQVVIVDDGGSDDVAGMARGFRLPITVVRQEHTGAARARNHGIESSAGGLLAFLDADDYWEPAKLERQLDVLARHPEVGFLASALFDEVPGEPRSPARIPSRLKVDHPVAVRRSALVDFVRATSTIGVMVRRGVLGEDRFAEDLPTAEDRDLWIRLLARTTGYFISEPLATAVLEAGSLSRLDPDGDYPNMLEVIARNRRVLGVHGERRWKGATLGAWAAAHLASGHARRAIGLTSRRLLQEPWAPAAWWVLAKAMGSVVFAPDRKPVRPDDSGCQ